MGIPLQTANTQHLSPNTYHPSTESRVQRYKEKSIPTIHFPRLVTSIPTDCDLSLEESVECNLQIVSSLLFTFYLLQTRKGKKVKGKVVKCMECESASKN